VILAGDIGGTNARLALFREGDGTPLRAATFPSQGHTGLAPIVEAFLGDDKPRVAVLGVAGPVVDNKCKATNLPWTIDGAALGRRFGIPKFELLNDLVSVGFGCLAAPSKAMKVLSGPKPKRTGATVAVIAAGTGLGECSMVWAGNGYVPCASEGSHVDFAARSKEEFELFTHFQKRFGHVSYERLVSGMGLTDLYSFFAPSKELSAARARLKGADLNREITRLAGGGETGPGQSSAARRAVHTLLSLYGAEAGNLALKTLATGGVFLCGGIINTLRAHIPGSGLVESFLSKGRMRPLLERTPLVLVTEPELGIAGSLAYAERLAQDLPRTRASRPKRHPARSQGAS